MRELETERTAGHRANVFVVLVLAVSAALVLTNTEAFGAERKEVLVLYGLQSDMPIVADWDRGIRSAIRSELGEQCRIENEFLDLLRTQDETYRDQWISLLRKKYEEHDPDVIVAVFDPALSFVLKHREKLFPSVPVVFCTAHFFDKDKVKQSSGLTGVEYKLSFNQTLKAAKHLRPETQRVVVVAGSSDFGTQMLEEARNVFSESTDYEVTYLAALPIEQLLSELSELSDDAVILFLVYVRDPAGRHHYANDVLRRISEVSSVPVFSLWDTNLGSGTIGGELVRIEHQGRLAGEMAARVMQGEAPGSIPVSGKSSNELIIDWNELRRWDMKESQLPDGAIVINKEVSFWQEYRLYILLSAAVILFQSALILGLLANRAKRRRAELSLTQSREEARGLAGRLITAQEDERKRFARELHDDLSQRLAANANDVGQIAANYESNDMSYEGLHAVRKDLVKLADDVHRLSHQLHPSILDDLGLEDALRSECESLSEREAIQVEFLTRDVPQPLSKPISLCVYRVAQEALWNASKHAAATNVTVQAVADTEFICLTVQDNGKGFEPGKANGQSGLGMASIRERVRLVNGELSVNAKPGSGTKVEIRIPLDEAQS